MTTSRDNPHYGPDGATGRCQTAALLATGPLGEISVCSAGCLHIDTPALSVRLTEREFLMLRRSTR